MTLYLSLILWKFQYSTRGIDLLYNDTVLRESIIIQVNWKIKLLPSSPSIFEGVRARVSQPSFYNSLPVCSIKTFRTYLKENRQVVN